MITATAGQLTITVPRRSAAATIRSVKLVDVEREHIREILGVNPVADPWQDRRRRARSAEADHARDAHGEARTDASEQGRVNTTFVQPPSRLPAAAERAIEIGARLQLGAAGLRREQLLLEQLLVGFDDLVVARQT